MDYLRVIWELIKQQRFWETDVNRKWTFCITGQKFGSNSQVKRKTLKEKKLSNTNLLASRHIKREKASLPVDLCRSKTSLLKLRRGWSSLLKSDDAHGDVNVKMGIGLVGKTTILRVLHAFSFISLLSLHDYDVKMPKVTFYRERNAPINVNPEGRGMRAKGWWFDQEVN